MNKIHDYLVLNSEGIFPGPKETEEEFCQRIALLRTEVELPSPPLSEQEWTSVHCMTEDLFDIKPSWVPAFYRNKKMPLWEAAAVWDYEGRSVIQLRKQLQKGRWGFVYRDEVLAHEAAHAARMAFNEPRFEEMICYQTSRSSWRKWLGPLFRHPWEAVLCMLGVGFPMLFFLVRTMYDQMVFRKCTSNIQSLAKKPVPLILRLSDKEIALFAKSSHEAILSYIEEQKKSDLRWQIIATAYL